MKDADRLELIRVRAKQCDDNVLGLTSFSVADAKFLLFCLDARTEELTAQLQRQQQNADQSARLAGLYRALLEKIGDMVGVRAPSEANLVRVPDLVEEALAMPVRFVRR